MSLDSVRRRIERIEAALFCPGCQMPPDFAAEYESLRRRAGLALVCGEADKFPSLCWWCGRVQRWPLNDYAPDERELIVRCAAAFDEGTLCLPEVEAAFAERDAMFRRADARLFGPLVAEMEDFHARAQAYTEGATAGKRPLIPYLCRVEGCACDFAKTREEWERNTAANGYRDELRGVMHGL